MPRRHRWTLVLPVLLATALSASKPAGNDSAKHQVVRVTDPEARRPCEVSVAINPTNPDHVVAVSMQAGRPGGPRSSNYAYVSTDGGRTWKTVPAPNPGGRVQGDDAIAFGPDGTAHHAYIAFDGIRVARPLRAFNGIFVSSSRDGVAWNDPVPVVDHLNTVEPFEDKPYLVVDASADSPHRGNVYVAWTRFDVYGSKAAEHKTHVYISRSRDGGKSFSVPWRISDVPGDCLDSDNTVMGAMPATGPKGEVYVTWAGPRGIVFDKSTDGGWTFGSDITVAANPPGGWDLPAAGIPRHNGLPVIGVDLSQSKHRGAIYVNWIDERNGDLDVFLASSRDAGATWSEPVRVNDDPKGNGKAQLFTWMAVDRVDGSVNVLFFDRRDQPDTNTEVVLARSVDGGRTFANHRIKQAPFACERGVFFGDYIGIAAHAGRVIGVYTHFTGPRQLALSAVVFRFKPGSQEAMEER